MVRHPEQVDDVLAVPVVDDRDPHGAETYFSRPCVAPPARFPPYPSRQVVIDEIQKVPALLDEVHWLIENRGLRFALCGSSARKVRRGAANLLGGRALRYELRGLTAGEIGDPFDLDRILNRGYLPSIYESSRHRRRLDAYIADYLREEVAAEGLVRNLPAFPDFLDAAALSDTSGVNCSNVARECGVSGPTAKAYDLLATPERYRGRLRGRRHAARDRAGLAGIRSNRTPFRKDTQTTFPNTGLLGRIQR
ncbi:MAG: AAA family ATPase [Acidimicrobiaceae bacterium]|nr:AAA family ATPase [Acidimicrobiaceae bacterium]MYE76398.1 AAA family ATPase [Acidimicrobiaceae bacterium]MYJ42542.1 AAA family ATPase [Acidimicrobiaceae bacterium]